MTPLDRLLGQAYRTSVLESRRDEAVSAIREALDGDEALKQSAQTYVASKAAVPHDRCFITSTNVGLLKAALA